MSWQTRQQQEKHNRVEKPRKIHARMNVAREHKLNLISTFKVLNALKLLKRACQAEILNFKC